MSVWCSVVVIVGVSACLGSAAGKSGIPANESRNQSHPDAEDQPHRKWHLPHHSLRHSHGYATLRDQYRNKFHTDRLYVDPPSFEETTPAEVKAQVGSHAYLSCRIRNLGDRSVSWIRNRDSHILSVDKYTFIADDRFVSWFDPQKNVWTLQVKFVEERDAGRYECQVSTEPKLSHFVHLVVVTPKVMIVEGPELYVRSGSTVSLRCVIGNAVEPPSVVFWYHDNKRILPRSFPGILQVPARNVSSGNCLALLIISKVSLRHRGNYTCAPAGLPSSSTLLHVLKEEHHAAMQQSRASFHPRNPAFLPLLLPIFFLDLLF